MSAKNSKAPRRATESSEVKSGILPSINLKIVFIVISLSISSCILPKYFQLKSFNEAQIAENSRKLRYWNVCEATWNENGNLRTMNRVFERLGYEYVDASKGGDWDVLWAFEYPYDHEGRSKSFDPIYSKPLQPHQKINHIPGISVVTNKSYMTTSNSDLPFIMPTFHFNLQKEFKEYVAKNPKRKFVRKSYTNRGVRIIDKERIDFKAPDTLYQAFMDKPFLIDGHAFDMGIYVLISSVDPLRVYRWNSDILLRFCPEPYYPFDPLNIEKYVIYESHKHFSEMPSFKPYLEHNDYTLKILFANYLKKKGHDITKIFKQVDEIIAVLLLRSEQIIVSESLTMLNSTKHGFDLLRFDFLIDETLKVYLMEVNLSPNITPTSEKFEVNAKLREQMVHDALKLVGAGSYFDMMYRYDPKAKEMMSHNENIAVAPEVCVQNYCHENCHLGLCELCPTCLSEHLTESLRDAFVEHKRRGEFRRVYPRSFLNFNDVSKNNRISSKWFHEKCQNDPTWC